MFPLHIALASTSRSSSDVEGALVGDKTGPNALLTPTAIRVIQLVEMPAPPRRMPPSSASASSASSSASSSSGYSVMDLDAEEQEEEEDCDSYCSSAADDEDDEEEALAREAEASKVGRILAWRAHIVSPTIPHPILLSPTTPRPRLVPPPLSLSPTTPTRNASRKRSAASSSCFSESSAPRSKRSRTSSVHCTAGPSEYSRVATRETESSRMRGTTPAPLFLAPPSPTTLARRHTSPRHQRHSSSPSAHPSVTAASSSAPALYSPTTPKPDFLRTLSMSVSVGPETLCPACDHAFTSVRAFRVHALHSADADASTACGAAVAYTMEAVRGPVYVVFIVLFCTYRGWCNNMDRACGLTLPVRGCQMALDQQGELAAVCELRLRFISAGPITLAAGGRSITFVSTKSTRIPHQTRSSGVAGPTVINEMGKSGEEEVSRRCASKWTTGSQRILEAVQPVWSTLTKFRCASVSVLEISARKPNPDRLRNLRQAKAIRVRDFKNLNIGGSGRARQLHWVKGCLGFVRNAAHGVRLVHRPVTGSMPCRQAIREIVFGNCTRNLGQEIEPQHSHVLDGIKKSLRIIKQMKRFAQYTGAEPRKKLRSVKRRANTNENVGSAAATPARQTKVCAHAAPALSLRKPKKHEPKPLSRGSRSKSPPLPCFLIICYPIAEASQLEKSTRDAQGLPSTSSQLGAFCFTFFIQFYLREMYGTGSSAPQSPASIPMGQNRLTKNAWWVNEAFIAGRVCLQDTRDPWNPPGNCVRSAPVLPPLASMPNAAVQLGYGETPYKAAKLQARPGGPREWQRVGAIAGTFCKFVRIEVKSRSVEAQIHRP
ncbi:hypothetical protein K438DRAFT_1752781 [Mycena galopus ATCC 62051]|nr:hypothetical protein K438DRAFT_1752781 [Mycena galopus ATCC 62051]